MKKSKKITSLLIASALTAGTISATTAGAIAWFYNGSEMEKELEDYIMIPYDSELYSGWYINKYDSSCLVFVKDNMSNVVQMWIDADADIDNVEKKILEVHPSAFVQISLPCPQPNGDVQRWVTVLGYEGKLPYIESKEKNITLEQARNIYTAISEIENIESFEYREKNYMPQFGEGYLTSYLNRDREIIEEYISENNLNCHIGSGAEAYNNPDYIDDDYWFFVIPDE